MHLIACFIFMLASVQAQHKGTQTKENHIAMTIQKCSKSNGCTPEIRPATMDGNWRWLHKVGTWHPNCFGADGWNATVCPDPETCTKNCAMDGIDTYAKTYGVHAIDNGLQLDFETDSNVGSRMYLLEDEKSYKMFKLVNQEFTFDVDFSQLGCGLNGALYFTEMPADGGSGEYPTNTAGAAFGTGYCDAQCPKDIKWIYGEANLPPKGKNGSIGDYGSCCSEMDIWEANKMAAAFTPHPCKGKGRVRCEGSACDDVCDSAGCDFNNYRMGNRTFLGPGSQFQVDSTQPVTVVTQFISSDGTSNGDLVDIKRFYVQNGKVIPNGISNIPGLPPMNYLSDENCAVQKKAFGDSNDFQNKGGMKVMGEALKRGMVLVMSLWDDDAAYMLWLDAPYPADQPPSNPGVTRGPCSPDSGRPADVEKNQKDAYVKYFNIKYGDIDSTFNR